MLKVTAQKGKSSIVLQGRSGWRVEAPEDCPHDKFARCVTMTKKEDVGRIVIQGLLTERANKTVGNAR